MVSFLFVEFEPGLTATWDGDVTPYLDGCDLGDVRVHVNGSGSTIVTPIPAGSASSGRAMLDGPVMRQALGTTEVHQAGFDVPAGKVGMGVGVKGQGGRLARFVLKGPKGERLTADPASATVPSLGKGFLVGNDERLGVTNILIEKPSAGRWSWSLSRARSRS